MGNLRQIFFVKPTDTHQSLDPTSCHRYHCKKGIRYSQALRLSICSDSETFDRRCNDLEKWLMDRGYNEKMITKQKLSAREHSRNDLLEKEKQQLSEKKLTFNITYYPVFRNVMSIMEELHILLIPNKEHKKVFSDVPVVGFQNGKGLKDYLLRAKLPKLDESGRCEPCGKKTCLVCDSISSTTTFTTEACQETFKIQRGPLNCDSKKVLFLLKFKVCRGVSYVGKPKTKFCYRFSNYKSKHKAFRKGNQKVPQKRFHAYYCLNGHSGIDDRNFVIFEQCETHEQLKGRETFWQHRLKTFYPIGLNEKEEYLY